jgi:hypothetical protein
LGATRWTIAGVRATADIAGKAISATANASAILNG